MPLEAGSPSCPVTLRQGAQNHGQTVGPPQMVGTPADVADKLEAYLDFVGGVASCSRRSIAGRGRGVRRPSGARAAVARRSGGNTPGSRSATISVRIAEAPAGAMPRTDHP
jgi:hypothetical protein